MSNFSITTVSRFKTFSRITGTVYDTILAALIPQVSQLIARYLRADLVDTVYYAWLNGNGGASLLLPNWPVTAVYNCGYRYNVAANITNTSTTVSQALVSCDGTNLYLNEYSNLGVNTITTLLLATYPTITLLKAAVENVTGWTMPLMGTYPYWPSCQIRPFGAGQATSPDSCEIDIPSLPEPVRIISDCEISMISAMQYPGALNYGFGYGVPTGMISHGMGYGMGYEIPLIEGGFPKGLMNIYVNYRAGYVMPTDSPASDGTLPPGLEMVAQLIIRDFFTGTGINSMMKNESIGDYSYGLADVASAVQGRIKDLNQYRRFVLA